MLLMLHLLFRFTVIVLLLRRLRHGQTSSHINRIASGMLLLLMLMLLRLLVAVDPLVLLMRLVLLLAVESCIELCYQIRVRLGLCRRQWVSVSVGTGATGAEAGHAVDQLGLGVNTAPAPASANGR